MKTLIILILVTIALVSPCFGYGDGNSIDGMHTGAGLATAPIPIFYLRITFLSGKSANLNFNYIQFYNSDGQFSPSDMTSTRESGGFVAASSEEYSDSYGVYRAFNASTTVPFYATQTNGVPGQFCQLKCPRAFDVTKYAFTVSNGTAIPYSWRLESSWSGAFAGEQNVLHTVTSYNWAGDYSRREFVIK